MSEKLRNGHRRHFLIVGVVLVLAKLWLVEVQDLVAIGGAGHDDRLFIDRAQSLLAGDWLGPYEERTLIKGPFYSVWIAATFLAGVPLLLSQHLLYASASAVLVLALFPLLNSRSGALFLFALLLFNPATFSGDAVARVLRGGIDPALALLVAACGSAVFLRWRRGWRACLGWSLALGLAMGAFWLNREEAVWIVPLVAVALTGVVVGILRGPRGRALPIVVVVLLPLVIWQICVVGVRFANLSKYGSFVLVEIKSKEFKAAWGALSRAGAREFKEYVPMSENVRQQIYGVSPSFAELQPLLESGAWRGPGCSWVRICDDLVGSWALFATRHAAALAGHHRSAASAAIYYARLASEVNTACDSGVLQCGARRATLAPVLHAHYLRRWPGRFGRVATALMGFEGISTGTRVATGSESQLELFRTLTREKLASATHDGDPMRLEGWAFSRKKQLEFVVLGEDGSRAQSRYRFHASPGLIEQLFPAGDEPPNARRARFRLWTFCTKRCSVEVFAGADKLTSFRLDQLPSPMDTSELFLQVDSLHTRSAAAVASKLRRGKLAVLEQVARLYGLLGPVFVVMALLALLAETVVQVLKRKLGEVWVLSTGILMSVSLFLALISLIDLTSFPAIGPRYLAPAYPLMLAFTFLMCRTGVSRIATYWR